MALTDDRLLAQCEVDTYRASGPGGQKRNKTSSAVRLRHSPSGLIVIAEESRSQHENKARALKRLRQALPLKLRLPLSAEELAAAAQASEVMAAKNTAGRLEASRREPRYWQAAAVILDVLDASAGRVHDAAATLGVSTANLIDFLQTDPKAWAEANALRHKHGHKALRAE
jgi:protein subunit release factor B